jgi:diacylglycerol kinase
MLKFIQSFKYALLGISRGLTNHRNFRIQFFAAIFVVILGFVLNISSTDWGIILIAIIVVLALELMNTSIEELLNHLHPSQHPNIGRAKDFAAGAVLLASIGAAIIGIIVFGKYINF